MKKEFSALIKASMIATVMAACSGSFDNPIAVIELPYSFNSPASMMIDSQNNILLTSPNLHNDMFIKQGLITKRQSPAIGKIDNHDEFSLWYRFSEKDMEPKSKTLVPMGIAKGPDGHIYLADMQLWAGGESRILRIKVLQGNASEVEVVAKGLSFPNALAWRGKELFITDTQLANEKGKYTISGLYKIHIDELSSDSPLQIQTYKSEKEHDKHLFETFISNGSLGFGANGLAIDNFGNLYTGMMEEGTIYKTTLDNNGKKLVTSLFNKGLIANDGIHWDNKTQALYTTDLFDNAVYQINLDGSATLLLRNGNTDGKNGLIDGPSEVIIRNNKAYIANFDAAFGVPNMVNKAPDAPVTISVLSIK